MKIKLLKRTTIILILILLVATMPVQASVEIKDTASVLSTETVGTYYQLAKDMNTEGQVLEDTSVDVHMANNKEWATLSYFSNSVYGTDGEGENSGISIKTNGNNHYTTNGNATGVMDWGRKITYVAAVISNYANITSDTVRVNGANLLNAIGTDSYIELFPESNAVEFARNGWYRTLTPESTQVGDPYCVRVGLWGFTGGWWNANGTYIGTSGDAVSNTTFRPVFYNP